MALITCQDVSIAYDGKTVVSGLNFHVEAGDYLCIVGENGAGKSTLVKGMLGLLKLSDGSILAGDGLKQKEIGYLPQQSAIQRDFPASVYEVVLSGCLNSCGMKPFFGKAEKRRAADCMEKLHIAGLKKHCYRELSGGQQQRVLLARALCAPKKLMLLDEPVNGLDPIAASELYELIRQLNRDNGMTILMVSHDMHSAVHEAGVILHLDTKVRFFGPREEYLKSDAGKRFVGGCAICRMNPSGRRA